MLSYKTMQFYRSLWQQLREAKGLTEADRKPLHAQLGLPDSSKDFTPEHFDEWKRHVLAETRPWNVNAQIDQLRMPATRKLVFIGHLLAALRQGEEDAERIVSVMNRGRKMGGKFTTLQTLAAPELKKVMIALKKECRRMWKTKDELLREIHAVRAEGDFDEAHACGAVMSALNVEHVPVVEKLCYEDLLVVLSALRGLVPMMVTFGLASKIDGAEMTTMDAVDRGKPRSVG